MSTDDSINNFDSSESEDDSVAENSLSSDPDVYFRNISLDYFVVNPREMLASHVKLKKLCLDHDNAQAHYIEGFLRYFFHDHKRIGLRHLRLSSIGGNEYGTYLYGLLLLARGYYQKGKKYMDKLNWKLDIEKSDHCWTVIKTSLMDIRLIMRPEYSVNLMNIRPSGNCNLDNMVKLCDRCYYFKRLNQFVQFARNKD